MKRPDHYLLGSCLWTVAWYDKGGLEEGGKPQSGVTHPGKQLIEVDSSESTEDAKDTFLHEVLHSLLRRYGISATVLKGSEAIEESLVALLTPALLDWMRMNPEAVAYLVNVDAAP